MRRLVLPVPSLLLLAGLMAAEEAVVTGAPLTVEADAEAAPSTGTKTDTPLLQQPQSLTIVDADQIRERHAIKLEEAIRDVAGVTIGGYYNDWDYFRIRGFASGDSTRHDGLFASPGYWITPDVYGAETVEVLKGPSSMLYGRSSLGGMVNIVSKKPRHDDFAEVMLAAGTEHFAELGLDGGTTFADDTVGVRLVALARNRGVFTDGIDDSQRYYIAPSVTWWAGRDTTITLLSHFQKDDLSAAWPLPASGFITHNPEGDIPRERNIGEPGFQNLVDDDRAAIGYELDHRFTETVSLRQNLRLTRIQETFQGIYPQALQADNRTLERTVYTSDSTNMSGQVDTMLDVDLVTGDIGHDVLFGVDLWLQRSKAFGEYAAIDPIDIFDPEYGAKPGPLTPYTDSVTTSHTVGVYLQDQIAFTDQWTVIAGLRWDRNDTKETEDLTGDTTTSDESALTWRVGVSYLVVPTTSLFASYSTSFTPQPYNTDADGEVVDPETGNQIEVGARYQDPEGLCNGTIAVFQILREDVATADLSNPGASVVSGEQRSRGLELDGMVKPVPGLSLSGTYAFIKAEVTKDNSIPEGDRLLNVPDHSVTAWLKYTLQGGVLRGLGAGVGGRWYSDQAGDLPNTFDLPAYTVVDTGLFYDRGPLSAQLNVYNLLDEEYAIGSYDSLYVLPGDPLTVRGSVTYTF